jgi:exodeoxyribonuclease-3
MKIISWNVNGLRAVWNKGALQELLAKESPDILCIQETKATEEQLTDAQKTLEGKYVSIFESAKNRKGYSGVAIYTKEKLSFKLVHATLGKKDFYDEEGRTIVAEFEDFYLINCYFPNGGKSPEHYEYKLEYYKHFLALAKKLEKKKPVIWCGDVNATNSDIDLARPKENAGKLGCTEPERKALAHFVENFTDTYRYIQGDKIQYTWWDMKTRSREKNVGWRIDYMYTSEGLKDKIKNAHILDDVMGSDHCPISLEIDF